MLQESLRNKGLGQQLVQSGVISRLQYVEAFALASASGLSIERVLVERGYATPDQIEQARFGLWRMVRIA